jgi:hypothetical protein
MALCNELSDWILEDIAHFAITGFATRNLVASIPKSRAIGQHNLFVVQLVSPQDPIRKYVLVVKFASLAPRSTNEATITVADFVNEPVRAEIEHLAGVIMDRVIWKLKEH